MGFEGLFKGMYGLDGTLNGLVWGIQAGRVLASVAFGAHCESASPRTEGFK